MDISFRKMGFIENFKNHRLRKIYPNCKFQANLVTFRDLDRNICIFGIGMQQLTMENLLEKEEILKNWNLTVVRFSEEIEENRAEEAKKVKTRRIVVNTIDQAMF